MRHDALTVPSCRRRVETALQKIAVILATTALTGEELKRWTAMRALLMFGRDEE